MTAIHFGRSWSDTRLEDDCPCPKAACGLVSGSVPECDQHSPSACRTIRQAHSADYCPGGDS